MFFAFPTSPRDELQFRDGMRVVPEYLAVLMASVETELYTYEEACRVVNSQMLGRHMGGVIERTVSDHMTEVRRDGNR